jgi:hypothetical protein
VAKGDVVAEGKARATRYKLSDQAHLLMPLNLDTYFAQDVDEREVQTSFNFDLACGDRSRESYNALKPRNLCEA